MIMPGSEVAVSKDFGGRGGGRKRELGGGRGGSFWSLRGGL